MTPALWSATLLLVAAALTVAWPVRAGRARRRALLGPGQVAATAVGGARRAGPADDASGVVLGVAMHDHSGTADYGGAAVQSGAHQSGADHGGAGQHGTGRGGGHADPRAARSDRPAHLADPRVTGPGRSATRPASGGPPGRHDLRRPAGPYRPRAGLSPDGHTPAWRVLAGRAWRSGPRPGWLPLGRTKATESSGGTRRLTFLAVLAGGVAGGVVGGPVAAVVTVGYGTLGARAWRRRHAGRHVERARRRRLDQLCALAADLRAGLPVSAAADGTGLLDSTEDRPRTADGWPETPPVAPDRLRRLALAAVRLADRTGAPLAELVERIEADARATDRGLAAAAAQAAGARATAWLLAALPIGGIGLGYGIGVDPVAVLLHTPLGGGCAIAAMVLQVVGLLWAERLGALPGGAR
ncbi:hypothetical protein AB0H57_04435 [Micromonospora sp. NPDC050686]|uniref:type II secretion system F family protein n=1 Tax=Micromonospora sp. NPDC050686 TaxID=3154631 RepID=UPI0033D8B0CF